MVLRNPEDHKRQGLINIQIKHIDGFSLSKGHNTQVLFIGPDQRMLPHDTQGLHISKQAG